jgi:hypothetical protein
MQVNATDVSPKSLLRPAGSGARPAERTSCAGIAFGPIFGNQFQAIPPALAQCGLKANIVNEIGVVCDDDLELALQALDHIEDQPK